MRFSSLENQPSVSEYLTCCVLVSALYRQWHDLHTYALAVVSKSVPKESDMLLKLSSWEDKDGIIGNAVSSVPDGNAI